jgi:ferredoxin
MPLRLLTAAAMTEMASDLPGISAALSPHGLILRGGFNFDAGEDAPAGSSGAPARAVLLVGQGGAGPWPHFKKWRETQPPDLANPLDTWSAEMIGRVAREFGARAVSPSDRPFLPFQQWAMRAEGLKPSPLGILMHPEYGLWHAYRGALLFDRPIGIEHRGEGDHPCDGCASKPCLSACPVQAFTLEGFVFEACVGHLRSPKGGACLAGGCLARKACPIGTAYRYPAEVQAFHMAKFVR